MGSDEDILTPILNGKEIMETFKDNQGVPKKAGRWMNDVVNFVKTLKNDNPNITKEEAKEKLKNRFKELLPKGILDGNDIIQMFPNKRPGAWVREVQNFVAQLPYGTSKEDAIQAVRTQFPSEPKDDITTASKNDVPRILCPKPLLEQKKKELKESFEDKQYYLTASIIKDFVNEFGNDEDAINLIARYLFLLITVDKKLKDRDVMQHVFTKAENEIYNCTLGCFVFGMLLILNTKTEDDAIREMGNRVLKLQPKLLKAVIELLPADTERIKIKKEFEEKVKNK